MWNTVLYRLRLPQTADRERAAAAVGSLLACLSLFGAIALADMRPEMPVRLTAAEDHRRLLHLLNIGELRRGADGDPAPPLAANYDEARANAHMASLPDPLRTEDGEPIENPAQWWSERRPKLVEYFEREIYGRVPADLPPVQWRVEGRQSKSVAGGAVLTESVRGVLDAPGNPALKVEMRLAVTYPETAGSPVAAEPGRRHAGAYSRALHRRAVEGVSRQRA